MKVKIFLPIFLFSILICAALKRETIAEPSADGTHALEVQESPEGQESPESPESPTDPVASGDDHSAEGADPNSPVPGYDDAARAENSGVSEFSKVPDVPEPPATRPTLGSLEATPREPIRWKQVRDLFAPVTKGGGGKPSAAKVSSAKPKTPVKAKNGTGSSRSKRRVPHLTGVMVGERGKSVAILDQKMLKPGETINGFTVKKITANEVVLSHAGEEVTLYVKK